MTFVFDKDYDNVEQVRPFFARYLAVREGLDGYPYNDSFRGKIPGIAGDNEDTGIYLLQTMFSLDELAARRAAFLDSGGEEVSELDATRRGTVVDYGFYMSGTGWTEYRDARLVPRDGKPYAVLPKGKRTNGHLINGRVLIRADR